MAEEKDGMLAFGRLKTESHVVKQSSIDCCKGLVRPLGLNNRRPFFGRSNFFESAFKPCMRNRVVRRSAAFWAPRFSI